MRTAVLLSLLLALCGCEAVPPQAWNFDPTQPQARVLLPPEQAAALTDRMAQLQLERNAIRARIAIESDVWARQAQYRELHRVGMELSPLERQLAAVESGR